VLVSSTDSNRCQQSRVLGTDERCWRQVAPGEHYDDGGPSISGGDKRPTGKVVGIIKRSWRTRGYAGSLQPDRLGRRARRGGSNVLFCPVERKYPFVRIHTSQVCSAFLLHTEPWYLAFASSIVLGLLERMTDRQSLSCAKRLPHTVLQWHLQTLSLSRISGVLCVCSY
jgi:exoribonuclease R